MQKNEKNENENEEEGEGIQKISSELGIGGQPDSEWGRLRPGPGPARAPPGPAFPLPSSSVRPTSSNASYGAVATENTHKRMRSAVAHLQQLAGIKLLLLVNITVQ